jgi:hypothetical protein
MSRTLHDGPARAGSDALARTLASEHARATADLVDRHAMTLESVLAALRSRRLDDRAAPCGPVPTATGARPSSRS